MTHFVQTGSAFIPTDHSVVLDKLPPSVFSVMENVREGSFFLEEQPSFKIPGKLYGDVTTKMSRVVATYEDRTGKNMGTGVLLSGSKGSGKTLFSKLLSYTMSSFDIPTILVTQPHVGEGFFSLIKSIQQPAMFLFDEFDKVYQKHEKQIQLLTLFDGVVSSSGKMFVVTLNDVRTLTDFFLNRPGRFFYHFKYGSSDEAFIREYADQNLKDKTQIDELVRLSTFYADFNFDVLQSIVEEMNRYGESVKDAVRHLNTTPFQAKRKYKVKRSDRETAGNISPDVFNPLTDWTYVTLKDGIGEDNERSVYLGADNIVDFKPSAVTYNIPGLGVFELVLADDQKNNLNVSISDVF